MATWQWFKLLQVSGSGAVLPTLPLVTLSRTSSVMLFGGIAPWHEASKSDFRPFLQITLFSAEVSQNQYMQTEEPKPCLSMTTNRRAKEEKLLQKKKTPMSPQTETGLRHPFPLEGTSISSGLRSLLGAWFFQFQPWPLSQGGGSTYLDGVV